MKIQRRIPTNLVVGFLGTGKTTAVLHALQHKPAGTQWAVLVNEFGEIGIDGTLLADGGAEIRQVAGGCMCCVGNLPMRVALNNLIGKVQPERLLIEATGLGHPQAVIDTLRAAPYDQLLELRAVICLVDPRKLREPRYLQHPLFRDQLDIADVVVANKTDLCGSEDRLEFDRFLDGLRSSAKTRGWVTKGALEQEWLDLAHGAQRVAVQPALRSVAVVDEEPPAAPALAPDEEWPRRAQYSDGYFSCGWQFAASVRFDHDAVLQLLRSLNVLRVKGLLRTERGAVVVNNDDRSLRVASSASTAASALEIIHDAAVDWEAFEQRLLETRAT